MILWPIVTGRSCLLQLVAVAAHQNQFSRIVRVIRMGTCRPEIICIIVLHIILHIMPAGFGNILVHLLKEKNSTDKRTKR